MVRFPIAQIEIQPPPEKSVLQAYRCTSIGEGLLQTEHFNIHIIAQSDENLADPTLRTVIEMIAMMVCSCYDVDKNLGGNDEVQSRCICLTGRW